MKTERAIQRKVLTPYETAIINKINSRIEFLDFIKKGIHLYGFEKYESEINNLKLEKQLDSEPIVRVPYNLNKENGITDQVKKIINICLSQYEYKSYSLDDIIYNTERGDSSRLKKVIYVMLNNYSSISATNIAKIFNRSRQVVHHAITEINESLKKCSDKKLNELFYKINSHLVLELVLKDKFNNQIDIQDDNTRFDDILNCITKSIYGDKKIDFNPKSNENEILKNNNFINSIIVSLKTTEIPKSYICYYFNITTKKIQAINVNHGRRISNDISYKRNFNKLHIKASEDIGFINKKRKLKKTK